MMQLLWAIIFWIFIGDANTYTTEYRELITKNSGKGSNNFKTPILSRRDISFVSDVFLDNVTKNVTNSSDKEYNFKAPTPLRDTSMHTLFTKNDILTTNSDKDNFETQILSKENATLTKSSYVTDKNLNFETQTTPSRNDTLNSTLFNVVTENGTLLSIYNESDKCNNNTRWSQETDSKLKVLSLSVFCLSIILVSVLLTILITFLNRRWDIYVNTRRTDDTARGISYDTKTVPDVNFHTNTGVHIPIN